MKVRKNKSAKVWMEQHHFSLEPTQVLNYLESVFIASMMQINDTFNHYSTIRIEKKPSSIFSQFSQGNIPQFLCEISISKQLKLLKLLTLIPAKIRIQFRVLTKLFV